MSSEDKDMKSTSQAMASSVVEAEVKLADSTTPPSAPAVEEPARELKIEVHATAVHHEQVEPIVAHAQSHEISHNQAVNQLDSILKGLKAKLSYPLWAFIPQL